MKSISRFWVICALVLALLLALAAAGFSQWHLKQHTRLVADRLVLLNELRRGALTQYFATAEAEMHFWGTSDDILQAQRDLLSIWGGKSSREGFSTNLRKLYVDDNPNPDYLLRALNDAGDGSAYSELHSRLHPKAKLFVEERGYYDFFLIGEDGDVLYTVEKEADFGSNLRTGKWADSGLSEVFKLARQLQSPDSVVISDMQAYGPSAGAPAIFMAKGLWDAAGELLGVLVLQLPTDKILQIMNYTSGMAETGETYLVGPDRLMRSNSRFSKESTVLSRTVDTQPTALALAGEEGVLLGEDYRKTPVLSAYAPLRVGDVTWAVLAEIDQAEVEELAANERPSIGGVLTFFYGLSLWSIWYWRGRQLPAMDNEAISGIDLDTGDFGDGGGIVG